MDTAKKIGRRKCGSYGRPGSKALKKTASKAARRFHKESCRVEEEKAPRSFSDLLTGYVAVKF